MKTSKHNTESKQTKRKQKSTTKAQHIKKQATKQTHKTSNKAQQTNHIKLHT